MQRNAVVVTIISIIAVFGFLFLVYSLSNQSSQQPTEVQKEVVVVAPDDHIKWSPTKKVLLVEYADLQCPGCRTFHSLIKQIEADPSISKKVTFIFRHFPLVMHKNAIPAARAAEAAGEQEKFWEMTDALYDNQDAWAELRDPTDYFVKTAEKLKLDLKKFNEDMKSDKSQARINADVSTGYKVQVNSTPTFFLQGKKVEVETFDEFKKLLQDASK